MRNGKIACLPSTIREELNQRLENNEDGPTLLPWLNALPAVQTILQADFAGTPITKQNLSQWRLGGFREWQLRRDLEDHAREIVHTARDLHKNLDLPSLPGHLAASLATRYAALLNTWDGEPDPKLAEKLRLLHALTRDVALLQRTLHQSAQQIRQRNQQTEADLQNEIKQARQKLVNPIWAARQEAALTGLFGHGKAGEYAAKVVTAVNFDLPLPKPDPALQAEIKAESKEPAKTPRARKPKEDASANETTPTEPPLETPPPATAVKPSQSSDPTLTTAPEPTPDEPEINQTTLPKLQMTNLQ